jgi:arginine/ornithine transport system substrate-binding protein
MLRALIGLLLLAFGAIGPAAANELRVGLETAAPPFAFINNVGEFDGFNADLSRALCARMGVTCTFVASQIPEFAQKLQSRAVDFVPGLSITEARRGVADFTRPFYIAPNRFIVRRGTHLEVSPAGLAGKILGVRRGTVQDRFVTAGFGEAKIRRYSSLQELFIDLALGRLDTILAEEVASRVQFLDVELGADFERTGPRLADSAWFGDGIGIAVRKGDDRLRDALDRALQEIRENGTFDAIRRRYFTFELEAS